MLHSLLSRGRYCSGSVLIRRKGINVSSFKYRGRARQLIDFEGIKYGSITPTDIDGLIEYKNKAFLFWEFKLEGMKMPRGQELALTRLVDLAAGAGKAAAFFFCVHKVVNTDADVIAADAIVTDIYYEGEWYKTDETETLKAYCDRFIKWVEGPLA